MLYMIQVILSLKVIYLGILIVYSKRWFHFVFNFFCLPPCFCRLFVDLDLQHSTIFHSTFCFPNNCIFNLLPHLIDTYIGTYLVCVHTHTRLNIN